MPCAYVIPDGKWLGALKVQRKRRGKGRHLTKERVATLDKLGMVWDVDRFLWEQKFEAAQRYLID